MKILPSFATFWQMTLIKVDFRHCLSHLIIPCTLLLTILHHNFSKILLLTKSERRAFLIMRAVHFYKLFKNATKSWRWVGERDEKLNV